MPTAADSAGILPSPKGDAQTLVFATSFGGGENMRYSWASGSSGLRFCCPLLSATGALTRLLMTLSSSRVSQWQFRRPTPSLATHRLPRVGFPAFQRHYEGVTTSSVHFDGLIAFGRRYLLVLSSFAHTYAKSVPVCQVVVLSVSSLFWFSRRGDRRVSQVPMEPFRTFALLLDPAGPLR